MCGSDGRVGWEGLDLDSGKGLGTSQTSTKIRLRLNCSGTRLLVF